MNKLIALYRQAEDYFFRGISLKCLNLSDRAYAYMTGGAGLNFIYITSSTNNIDRILIEGKKFFDQDSFVFDVIIPQELSTQKIVDCFKKMDYFNNNKSVSMVLDLDKILIEKNTNLDVETTIKANNGQLNDWMIPLIGAFESTSETCSIYALTHKKALQKNVNLNHFSLYKQMKPIVSVTLSIYENTIARIDDLGTLPEFQGKGYATCLMRYVLSEAKRLGAHYCFLESSDSGIFLYQKLGFEPLFKNNIYSMKV